MKYVLQWSTIITKAPVLVAFKHADVIVDLYLKDRNFLPQLVVFALHDLFTRFQNYFSTPFSNECTIEPIVGIDSG